MLISSAGNPRWFEILIDLWEGCQISFFCQYLLFLTFSILQIKGEVRGVLEFIKYVYGIFGFTFDLKLSTVCYLLLIHASSIELVFFNIFFFNLSLICCNDFPLISGLFSYQYWLCVISFLKFTRHLSKCFCGLQKPTRSFSLMNLFSIMIGWWIQCSLIEFE